MIDAIGQRLKFIRGMYARCNGSKRIAPQDEFGSTRDGSEFWLQGYDYGSRQIEAALSTAETRLQEGALICRQSVIEPPADALSVGDVDLDVADRQRRYEETTTGATAQVVYCVTDGKYYVRWAND